jgi:hypothetical protein
MNPSLLLIPDRYKAAKLYSQIPDSGDGDLTFARASSATRVNSAGLIEKVRTNLVLQSEALNEAAWTKNRSTITANALINPVNGATTADYIVEDTSNGTHEAIQILNVTSGLGYTFSVYAKADTRTKIALILAGSAFSSPSNGQAIFDLSGGTIISTAGGATSSITSIGAGWYRCSITKTAGDTSGILVLSLVDASNNVSYTGDGASRAAFFGSQFEVSDFGATPYIPTTTAAVSVGITADIPRLDYTGGGCPSLLLEPQRTNLITFSEQFDNAGWVKVESSITANTEVSPDGYANADKFIANTTSNLHFANSAIANTAAPWTYSIFAKAAGYDRLIMWTASTNFVGFNLTTGVVESTLGTGVTSANIQNYGNGWYRCSITSTSTTSGTSVAFAVFNAAYPNGNINPIFTGNGTAGIFIYGAQFEAGSYQTSYIPTLGASVTRLADAASKTGISSLIGVNQGSIYLEFDANGLSTIDSSYIFDLSDNVNFDENRISMYWSITSNDLRLFYGYGGTFSESMYNFNFATTKKIGVRWTSTQIQVVVNGVAQTALTYGNSSPTKLNLASRFNDIERLDSNIKVCALYNNTLSTAELITLTTL